MRNVLLATGLILVTPKVFASPIEADLESGRRWAETKAEGETNGVQMNEVVFAARYKIAETGVAVGPSFAYSKFRSGDLGDDTTASNYELGIEAKYAHPVTEKLIPYGKVRYVGYSKGTMELDGSDFGAEMNFRTSGVHLGIGAAYALTEQVQLTGEVGYGVQMIRMTGGKITKAVDEDGNAIALADSDKTLDGDPREDFNSKSLMLGLNVSI